MADERARIDRPAIPRTAVDPPSDSEDDLGRTHYYGDDCDPPHVDSAALIAAARAVVREWGDGDDVDPDRMDGVVARLARLVPDS